MSADAPPPPSASPPRPQERGGEGARMFRSTFAIAFFTFLSRIAGFVRDVLMSAILGTGVGADAFFIAMRIANLGRALFAEGALNAAFVPMFSQHLARGGFTKARHFANMTLNWMLAILLLVTLAAELFMPFIVVLFAPGFGEVEGKLEQTALFSRIAFPFLLLFSLATLLSGALNSMGRFWVGAATPILLNLVMIAALLSALPHSDNPALLLSFCFPLAGVMQLALMLWAARRVGVRWRLQWPRPNPQLRKLLRLLWPVALAGIIGWGSLIVAGALASFQESAVSWLQYAERLYHMPLGLVAVSIGVVMLPTLSRRLRGGDASGALVAQNRALEFALLLMMPAMVILLLLPDAIVNVLFERARFTAADTRATAAALQVMALGLPGAVAQHIFTVFFYARQNTKSPLLYGAVANGVFVLAAFGFFPWLGYVGIALAGALAAWANALMLGAALRRGGALALDARFRRRMVGLSISSVSMFAALWLLHQGGLAAPLFASWGDGLAARTLALFLLIGVGSLVYACACQLGGAMEWREARDLILPGRGAKTNDKRTEQQ